MAHRTARRLPHCALAPAPSIVLYSADPARQLMEGTSQVPHHGDRIVRLAAPFAFCALLVAAPAHAGAIPSAATPARRPAGPSSVTTFDLTPSIDANNLSMRL